MIDHFGIQTADVSSSAAFYDAVLGVLGHRRLLDHGVAIGYGTDHPVFWIGAAEGAGVNREAHVAFVAADAEAVRTFHRTALEHGAESLQEPRLWPEYHDAYFGAFVRDPDGNNVEAVCHTGDGTAG